MVEASNYEVSQEDLDQAREQTIRAGRISKLKPEKAVGGLPESLKCLICNNVVTNPKMCRECGILLCLDCVEP